MWRRINLAVLLKNSTAQAEWMGRAFIAAGSALSGTPERLIFDKEAYDGRFGGAEAIRVSDLDEKYALSLTNELRSKIIRLEEITAQLSGMGIKV